MRQVTRLLLDVGTLKVAPTGNRLLLSLEVFPNCADLDCTVKQLEALAKSPSNAQIYVRPFIHHWDRWEDGRRSHLSSLAVSADGSAAGAPVDLTRGLDADVPSKPFGGDEEFNFSPDGMQVAFTARIKGKDEAWSTNFDVFETAAERSGEPRNLTAQNPAWDTEPTCSPDGLWLTWKAMDRPQYESERLHLVLADRKRGSLCLQNRSAQTAALAILQHLPSAGLTTVSIPIQSDGERQKVHRPAPRLGEHTQELISRAATRPHAAMDK